MGDPIIIWLPGTVYDYSGACQQYTEYEGSWACDIEQDPDSSGVYVTCCLPGG